MGQGLGELMEDILENIGGSFRDQGFKGRKEGAHLEDRFKGLLGFGFKVIRAFRVSVNLVMQDDVRLGLDSQ